MLFVESIPRRFDKPRERPFWRYVLFAAAATTALASTQPWLRVAFERLFGVHGHYGPPAWRSTTGFTCLSTCALVFVMALGETQTPRSKHAVRPASLMLVALMAAALLMYALQGPPDVRAVSGRWTISFYLSVLGSGALLWACIARVRAIAGRRPRRAP